MKPLLQVNSLFTPILLWFISLLACTLRYLCAISGYSQHNALKWLDQERERTLLGASPAPDGT